MNMNEWKKDAQNAHEWMSDPISKLNLSPEQHKFVTDNKLYLSSAYIGLLRVYLPDSNQCVFQTSMGAVLGRAIGKQDPLDIDECEISFKEWLNKVMSSTEKKNKLFHIHSSLFGAEILTDEQVKNAKVK